MKKITKAMILAKGYSILSPLLPYGENELMAEAEEKVLTLLCRGGAERLLAACREEMRALGAVACDGDAALLARLHEEENSCALEAKARVLHTHGTGHVRSHFDRAAFLADLQADAYAGHRPSLFLLAALTEDKHTRRALLETLAYDGDAFALHALSVGRDERARTYRQIEAVTARAYDAMMPLPPGEDFSDRPAAVREAACLILLSRAKRRMGDEKDCLDPVKIAYLRKSHDPFPEKLRLLSGGEEYALRLFGEQAPRRKFGF